MRKFLLCFMVFFIACSVISLFHPLRANATMSGSPSLTTVHFAPAQIPALIDLSSLSISDSDVSKNESPFVSFRSTFAVGKVTIRYSLSSDGFSPEYFTYVALGNELNCLWNVKTKNPYAGSYKIDYIQIENRFTSAVYKIYDTRSHTSADLQGSDMLADLSAGDYLTRPSKVVNVEADLYDSDTYEHKTVLVYWTNPGDVEGFRVYYKPAGATTWSYKDTAENYLIMTMPTAGIKYYFTVKAYTKVNNKKYLSTTLSETKSVYTLSRITLTASRSGAHYVKLTWPDIPGQTGYQIYRTDSYADYYYYDNFTKIKTLVSSTATSYIDTSTAQGKVYYYKVRAYKKIYYNATEFYYVYGPFSYAKSIMLVDFN